MKRSKLNEAIEARKNTTKEALQTLFDNINQGQRKQLVKITEIKELFDTFGVEY